jgi:hypothetical protein
MHLEWFEPEFEGEYSFGYMSGEVKMAPIEGIIEVWHKGLKVL